ncbi:MAG: hypothetical protein QXM31_02065 [Candidatus Woesearchaeota archaeon]
MKPGKNSTIWKILGIICIIVGVIGLFLPGIQGILLMLLGLSLLGYINFRKKK